jgi:hypothetical protein
MRLFKSKEAENTEKTDIEDMKAKKDISGLIKVMTQRNLDIRSNAAIALGSMGEAAVGPLIQSLKNENTGLSSTLYSYVAFEAIGEPAYGPLIQTLKSSNIKDVYFIQRVVLTLEKIKDQRLNAFLIQTLKDPNANVRKKSAELLGDKKDPTAVELLISAIKDPDQSVRNAAREALEKMGKFEETFGTGKPKEWLQAIIDLKRNRMSSSTWTHISLKAKPLESHLAKKIITIIAIGSLNEGGRHVLSENEHTNVADGKQKGVIIPQMCALCYVNPGTEGMFYNLTMTSTNTLGMLLGGPVLGEEKTTVQLPFKVCKYCSQEDWLPAGITIDNYSKKGDDWIISLRIPNENYAKEIELLNKEILVEN